MEKRNNYDIYYMFVVVMIGVSFVFTGMHDIDNAWNMNNLGKGFVDTNGIGLYLDAGQLYSLGILLVFFGVFILGISSFIFGFIISRHSWR